MRGLDHWSVIVFAPLCYDPGSSPAWYLSVKGFSYNVRQVTKKFKEFADNKRLRTTDKASMRELSQMIKKMPQYQKEITRYSTHLQMVESCMELCTKYVNKLCKVEQVMSRARFYT